MTVPVISRISKTFFRSIALNGAAGSGAVGTIRLAKISGVISIRSLIVRAITSVVGPGASVSLGVAGNPAGLIPVTSAPLLVAGAIWTSATPAVGLAPTIPDRAMSTDLLINVTGAPLTGGVIEVDIIWEPSSSAAFVSTN
jgi:hypothetical protein